MPSALHAPSSVLSSGHRGRGSSTSPILSRGSILSCSGSQPLQNHHQLAALPAVPTTVLRRPLLLATRLWRPVAVQVRRCACAGLLRHAPCMQLSMRIKYMIHHGHGWINHLHAHPAQGPAWDLQGGSQARPRVAARPNPHAHDPLCITPSLMPSPSLLPLRLQPRPAAPP